MGDITKDRLGKTVRRLRAGLKRDAEIYACVDVAKLSEEGRAAFRKNLGVMLMLTLMVNPAFGPWLAWRTSEIGKALESEQVMDEILALVRSGFEGSEAASAEIRAVLSEWVN